MLLNCGVGEDCGVEETLESPLDCKEIQPVHPKGNQYWIFTGRTDTDAEAPVLWPPDSKNWVIGKDPGAWKDWRWEEKGTTEDEMASPTWWTWVWVSSGSWWWTGKLGVLQSMGSQRVIHDWATELNWTLEGGSKRSYCNSCQSMFCLCLKYDCLQPMTLKIFLRHKIRYF